MKKVTTYNNKKVLVMGFGISGLNAAKQTGCKCGC